MRNAGYIIVLEHGELREQDSHDDLVAAGGIYAGLWRVQTAEQSAEPGTLSAAVELSDPLANHGINQ